MDYASAITSVMPGTFVPDIGKDDNTPVVSGIPGIAGTAPGGVDGGTSFKDTVKQLLSDVNDKMNVSDVNMRDMSTGKTSDLQKVVTSVEEANLALQYTMAIRTKLMDAYSEISRMQI